MPGPLRHPILLAALTGLAAGPAGAAFELPDPGIIIPPDLTIDPCFSADFEFDVAGSNIVYNESDTDYFANKRIFELRDGGTTVATVITKYERISAGETDNVSIENTFVFPDSLRLYGRASNDVAGLAGARGVIHSATTDAGALIDGKATYLFSTFDGEDSMCFWLEGG